MTGLPPDRQAHRNWLLSFLVLPAQGQVLDVGCGRGEDLCLLASRHPQSGLRFLGCDASAASVARARQAAYADARLAFLEAAVDALYSHNLLECLPDPAHFATQAARVLKPGGQIVVGHWDWDSQVYDAEDKPLVRRLVHAFADWQQDWMAHADGWMGCRLRGIFAAADEFEGTVHARVLLNTAYAPGEFGYENAQAMRSLVRRGHASEAEVSAFLAAQEQLARAGRYVYSITGYAYVGRRRATAGAA